jgi:hypothetical protein
MFLAISLPAAAKNGFPGLFASVSKGFRAGLGFFEASFLLARLG